MKHRLKTMRSFPFNKQRLKMWNRLHQRFYRNSKANLSAFFGVPDHNIDNAIIDGFNDIYFILEQKFR